MSHHIKRIGYHFRPEVVAEVVNELDYQFIRGQFIKTSELEAQLNDSRIAQIMARQGYTWRQQTPGHESTPQVRDAIRELFPRIPELDVNDIIRLAWEEGSQRVGTSRELDLPQRVQLATIARIRHTYTDYDRLLRAFGWEHARSLVEADCIRKLMEWRAEQDPENDEFEQIWRNIIVIDDDDQNDKHGAADSDEADDEDSAAEAGNSSDSSVEITGSLASGNDLGMESVDESSYGVVNRFQPTATWQDKQAKATERARQGLQVVREQLRQAAPLQHPCVRIPNLRVACAYDDRHPNSIQVEGGPHHAPSTITLNGKVYLRDNVSRLSAYLSFEWLY